MPENTQNMLPEAEDTINKVEFSKQEEVMVLMTIKLTQKINSTKQKNNHKRQNNLQ